MTRQLVTVGVYNTTEDGFFGALDDLGVDLFVDVRARRGLRGAKYAYANSARLQERLSKMGIGYLHAKDLAPTPEVREVQKQADHVASMAKRARGELAPEFCEAYMSDVATKDAVAHLHERILGAQKPALFCVEAAPAACHRSLLAGSLAELGWEVSHWKPAVH